MMLLHSALTLVLLAVTAVYGGKPPRTQCVTMCEPGYVAECVPQSAPTPSPAPATPSPTATAISTPTAAPVPTVPPLSGDVTGGWGSGTVAGDQSPICTVSNRNDSGTGSLRTCLSSGNRRIKFDVGGTWTCGSDLRLLSNTTIDGDTAPAPGVTINGCGINMSDVADIRIRNIRLRNPGSGNDTIQIGAGAESSTHPVRRVHLSHVSTDRCGDGNIDISDNSTDVTVDYSILSNCSKNSLIKYDDPSRITLHHNLYIKSQYRNPWVNAVLSGMSQAATNVHFENNVIWDWGEGGGIGAECGARVNIERSMFKCSDAGTCTNSRANNGIIFGPGCTTGGQIYSNGNVSPGATLKPGNVSTEFPRPVPDLSARQSACEAGKAVLENAGARPLDSIDAALIAGVHLGCN